MTNVKEWGCYGCMNLKGKYCTYLGEELEKDNYCPEYKLNFDNIEDSNVRRKFETGAVRDIQEGKGRCDLLPLRIIARRLSQNGNTYIGQVVYSISNFIKYGSLEELHNALDITQELWYEDEISMYLDVSIHFENGAKKYGERNWEKGIPLSSYMDSALRHFFKVLRGDKDENHKRAFVWNVLCAIDTVTYMPEMNDLPFAKKEGE